MSDVDPLEQAASNPAPADGDPPEQARSNPAPADGDPLEQARSNPAPADGDPFGEVLPDRSRDEVAEAWGDRADDDDQRLRDEVPPHHG